MNSITNLSSNQQEAISKAAGKFHATADVNAAVLSGVTPESIILMLQMRMKDVDQQIFEATARLEDKTNQVTALSSQLEALYKLKEKCAAGSKHTKSIDVSGTADEERMGTQTAQEFLEEHGLTGAVQPGVKGSRVYYSEDQIQKAIDAKKQEVTTLNSGNELEMVQLQNLIQQRSQVISLGSNLLKTLNETKDSVIRNML